MSTHGPVEEEVVVQMNAIGNVIADALPDGYGFTLLIFKTGDVKDGRMNYLSTANREDMLTAMKELIANFEGRAHEPPKRKQ
jgi:hypothetical protein